MGLFGNNQQQQHQQQQHHQHQPYDGPTAFHNGGGVGGVDADSSSRPLPTPTNYGPRPPLGGGVGEPSVNNDAAAAAAVAAIPSSGAAVSSWKSKTAIS